MCRPANPASAVRRAASGAGSPAPTRPVVPLRSSRSRPFPSRMTRASSPSSGSRTLEPSPSANHGTPGFARRSVSAGADILRRWPGAAPWPARRSGRWSSAPAARPRGPSPRDPRREAPRTNSGSARGQPVHSGDISRARACHSWSDRTSPVRLRSAMIASQAADGRRQGRGVGHPVLQGRAADGVVVLLGQLAQRRVDQQLNLPRDQQVDGVGPPLVHLEHPLRRDARGRGGSARCPRWRGSGSPARGTAGRSAPRSALSWSFTVTKTAPSSGSAPSAADLRLGERHPERVGDPHDLAGGAHLRAQDEVHARELVEGEDRLLHRDIRAASTSSCRPSSSRVLPTITAAARLASGTPVVLETNGTVRDARGFTSST